MATSVVDSDLIVRGTLAATNFNPPASSITNAAIVAAAGIEATKVVHRFPIHIELFGPAVTVTALTKLAHIASASGTIAAIEAIVITPATGADRTVTIDLQKGNQSTAFATVLSSTVGFTNSTAAREVKTGTISTSAYADGDTLELIVTVAGAAGNQALGLLVTVWLQENPQ